MDFSIKPTYLPKDDTRPVNHSGSRPQAVDSAVRQVNWKGMDRRRSQERRRGRRGSSPLVELRQRRDRRSSSSVNVTV